MVLCLPSNSLKAHLLPDQAFAQLHEEPALTQPNGKHRDDVDDVEWTKQLDANRKERSHSTHPLISLLCRPNVLCSLPDRPTSPATSLAQREAIHSFWLGDFR